MHAIFLKRQNVLHARIFCSKVLTSHSRNSSNTHALTSCCAWNPATRLRSLLSRIILCGVLSFHGALLFLCLLFFRRSSFFLTLQSFNLNSNFTFNEFDQIRIVIIVLWIPIELITEEFDQFLANLDMA